jgi:hypothetical protein
MDFLMHCFGLYFRWGWLLTLHHLWIGHRRFLADFRQGFSPFMTGFHCGRQILMISFCLDVVGIYPRDESTLKDLKLLVTGLYPSFNSGQNFLVCIHFFSVGSYFSQQAPNKIRRAKTGRNFHKSCREHTQAIRTKNNNSRYSKRILNTGHAYGSINNAMDIIKTEKKWKHLNVRNIPHM